MNEVFIIILLSSERLFLNKIFDDVKVTLYKIPKTPKIGFKLRSS